MEKSKYAPLLRGTVAKKYINGFSTLFELSSK